MLLFGAILFLIAVWLSFCIEIIREDERAVLITLGQTKQTIESGLIFKFWPFQWLKRFSTRQQQFIFEPKEVITRVGVFKGQLNAEEQEAFGKDKGGHMHGAAKLTVKTVLYIIWPQKETDPDGEALMKAVKRAPDPSDIEKVKTFFGEALHDAVKVIMGGKTWRECYEQREEISAEVEKMLKEDEDSPFFEAGIQEIHVIFDDIKLPPSLEAAITQPEEARLKALAREREGEGEREFIKKKGEGEAAARKMLFDAVTDENLPKEALFTLREMAQGKSNTILFPYGIYEDLSKALGGNKPEKLLAFLKPEDKDALLSLIEDLIKGGKEK